MPDKSRALLEVAAAFLFFAASSKFLVVIVSIFVVIF
jgi:hypothetical protein